MPRGLWTKKDERQYKAIVASCDREEKVCKRIAAATVNKRRALALGDWSGDAKKTMIENPDYFVWWYTLKSVGLVAAVAVAAYYAGKSARPVVG